MLVRGRIRRYGTLESSLNLLIAGVTVLPITPEIASLAAQFPRDYSGDPPTASSAAQPALKA